MTKKVVSEKKINREIKYIRGLAKVLNQIAKEAEEMNCFDKEAQNLIKKVGSRTLWLGCTLPFFMDIKD